VRPQLLVTVDLDSLLAHLVGWAGRPAGWDRWPRRVGPLAPEACQRLACDGAVTRVLVSRHRTRHPDHGHGPGHGHGHDHGHGHGPDDGLDPDDGPGGSEHQDHPETDAGLVARLRAAATRLPAALGGAPSQPLEVGRASRVVSAAQRAALVVRWAAAVRWPGCARPRPGARPPIWSTGSMATPPTWPTWRWCAGPTTGRSPRAAGGWRLQRHPDGRLAATPPQRRQRAAA
jgi:hypothetical protein